MICLVFFRMIIWSKDLIDSLNKVYKHIMYVCEEMEAAICRDLPRFAAIIRIMEVWNCLELTLTGEKWNDCRFGKLLSQQTAVHSALL